MTIIKRVGLGRPLEWSELDGNFSQVGESTIAAQQAASLASAAQQAAATSATDAAASASEASSQAAAASVLRADLASTDAGKGLSLSVAEDGTNGQQFYEKADKFAGAYEDGVITVTSINSWITYNGDRWYVKPGTTVPFTTTGLNSTSWATDSSNFTSPSYGIGEVLPDAIAIFNVTNNYTTVQVRGFYSANDGGHGVWVATGNTDTTKSGTHVPSSALIYNANGLEYQLSLSSNEIDIRANGAKEISGTDALTTDDFVCSGEVFNGIMSVFGYQHDDVSYSMVKSGSSSNRLKVLIRGSVYRVGKVTPQIRSSVSVEGGGCVWAVYPHSDYTFAKTGARIHGFSTKENASYWRSATTSWDLASWNYCGIEGITAIGDQKPSVTRNGCTAGIGFEIINPQHCYMKNLVAQGFLTGGISREWNSYIPSSLNLINSNADYILTADDSTTTQQGHFYGVNYQNVNFRGNRDCELINMCDWSSFTEGNIYNQFNWIGGVDAVKPVFLLINTGASWNYTGGQLGVYHDDTGSTSANYPFTYAPSESVVYDLCKQSSYRGIYSEWDNAFLTIGGDFGTTPLSTLERYTGLYIEFDTAYKPNNKTKLVRFRDGWFGEFSGNDVDGWTWTDGQTYSRGDIPRSLSQYTIGSPVEDSAAFMHGGFDFKYGTYNMGFSGTAPDVDSLRGTRDKGFINDFGLPVSNATTLYFNLLNPAYGSNIVIILKDMTDSFDPSGIVMNGYSYVAGSVMPNQYQSKANLLFDYGNGYKAYTVRNLRPFGYSDERGWSPQNYLTITTVSGVPIILKSIRAYVGGVPIFPQALPDYVPNSQLNGVFGTQSSATGCDLYPASFGGGIFQIGDKVAGWSYLKHNDRFTYSQDTNTYGYPNQTQTVNVLSTVGSYISASTFTCTVVSATASETIVEFTSDTVVKVFLGVPLYISSSTGTVTAGKYNLVNRLYNSDGTATYQYTVKGVVGAAGDVLTIDYSKMVYGVQATKAYAMSIGAWLAIGSTLSVANWGNFGGALSVTGSLNQTGYANFGAGLSTSGTIRGATTATYDLGSSGYTFNNAYLQNAVTVISDENHKPVIEELTTAEIACATACAKLYRKYKLDTAIAEKGEDGARYHFGTIAQYVIQAFTDAGLDWTKYGVVTYEKWDAQDEVTETIPAVTDDEGNIIMESTTIVVTPAKEAGEIYMVRYDEFNSFVIAGHEARLSALESK